jgi:putative aldouronate transport system substrate-binding protein
MGHDYCMGKFRIKASKRIVDENLVEGLKLDGKLYGISPARGNGCVTYVKKAWLDQCQHDSTNKL